MFKRFRTLLYHISPNIRVKRYNAGIQVTYRKRFIMVPNEMLESSKIRDLVHSIWETLQK